ncbi:MAG: glutaminyl-tRNA synthase (glutamine-hydrolyzing) subunit A [Candidatus Levybacteria bacterium RIFCSPHIGHO2_02_FULL_39_36]|nr:MAG: glutaminyl-tRNA synthase (glutamine-hydrolyzing) subunit A [Candidatus Levybacteria bacterium RIFCSPHIGHO2_12_FULL_39_39]OGH27361.1 MAG: glutaminyl-tRNA synthase (glutamine-hydrolyzing) subunit A [Candidatus Levybacteria bacterium RIFCSPHIGHO2_02_FULL_39_36]OGH45226.1 MAG: glutaminyl-tRNA synthase (glutamine-hydrolyzing) subunit A [Candidatus Levybacteria bacterium RIFCSPLOWO2_02_FULL_39_26]
MNNLNNLTIKQSYEYLNKKKCSSVELTSSCLEQIEKLNPEINAFITVSELALDEARKADELRSNNQELPLLGIPIALKDIYMTKGLRTTAASNVLRDYIPQYDATVVRKLKEAGAVILGKTNLDAWAHGSSGENSDFGPTKNPWDREYYVPGGSSSGSAAAVAANLCAAATGTDAGGSIRLPASFTNTVGLKPTYGLVSRYGIIAMASSLDSIGHFTKTVEDSALFLNITAGNDPFDATTTNKELPDYTKDLHKGIRGLKIGIPKEYLAMGIDKKIKENFDNALRQIEELGAEIIEISLPHTKYAVACYYIIQPSEVSSNLARYDGIRFGNDRSYFGDEAVRRIILGTFTLSAGYYEAYYKKAMQVRTLIKRDFEQVFNPPAGGVDAIIAPVSPTPPWKLGEKLDNPLRMYLSDIFTTTANLAGIPGLSVPSGFINGLPAGFQILGPQFSEKLLFQIGHAFEQTQERKILDI